MRNVGRVGWGKGPLWGQTPSADSLEIMWPGESRDSSSETLRKQRLLHERGARQDKQKVFTSDENFLLCFLQFYTFVKAV